MSEKEQVFTPKTFVSKNVSTNRVKRCQLLVSTFHILAKNNKPHPIIIKITECGLIICAAIDWDKNKVGSKSMENQT